MSGIPSVHAEKRGDCMIIEALCYAGYLLAAASFCGKYLGASDFCALHDFDESHDFDKSHKKEWLFFLLSLAGGLLVNMVNLWYPGMYILYSMLNHIIFIGLVLVLFRADREKKVLAASMLLVVRTLVVSFCESGLSCLALFLRHTITKVPEPFLHEREGILILCVSSAAAVWALCLVSKRAAPIFSSKMGKFSSKTGEFSRKIGKFSWQAGKFSGRSAKFSSRSGKWYIVLAVPLFLIVAVVDVANWGASNGIMIRSGGRMGLYYDQMFSHAEICVLTLLSMFAAGFYVFGMVRIDLEQRKSSRYHSQIAVYQMMAEQYRQTERLRHDMKNHIIALSGLYQSNEWGKMGHYLEHLESAGLEADGDLTGSKAVDALLYGKRQRAKKEAVKWECDVHIPHTSGIREFDLCIIFGNLLDNALEACERMPGERRFVKIQAKMVKKCFLLEIKNSMDRAEKRQAGFTCKDNPQEHGIGLLNVSDVVQRYNGAMKTEAEDGIFSVSILLPQKDSART